MSDPYSVEPGTPDVETFLALRQAGGLIGYSRDAARTGLDGTVFGVVVRCDSEVVGMGRIIGDGGCTFQICDIVVHPDHQGRGLGKRIMTELMDYVRETLSETAYVSLIADIPADGLYAQFGFAPTAPASIGMALKR